MRLVIQRVSRANVKIDDKISGEIKRGFVVLIGIEATDNEAVVDKFLNKMIKLRIFDDENGKANKSISDVGGSLLLISQFTLMADCRDGNRPSFINAGDPKRARELYDYMVKRAIQTGVPVSTGEFAADMKVELVNDGPFTIVLDNTNIK